MMIAVFAIRQDPRGPGELDFWIVEPDGPQWPDQVRGDGSSYDPSSVSTLLGLPGETEAQLTARAAAVVRQWRPAQEWPDQPGAPIALQEDAMRGYSRAHPLARK